MIAPKSTILITGASGGIGEAFAHLAAADGHSLILAARNEKELSRVAGVVTAKHQVPVNIVPCDLAKPDGVSALADDLARRNSVPDVVINNAGFGLVGKAAGLDREDQLGMIDLNIRALSDLTLRFLPAMLEKMSGGIINVASTAGFMPGPGMAVYFASKNYVTAFTDALHHEVRGSGVTITSLCPGPVITGFQARAGMRAMTRGLLSNTMTAEDAASAGWIGFKAGKRCVVPGVVNVLSTLAGRMLPRAIVLPIAARAVKGMRQ